MITVKTKVNVKIAAHGRKQITPVSGSAPATKTKARPKIPRISRLMGLAIQFDQMLRSGEATDMIELARRGHVTQPRMSQILSLNMLAPDIQEYLLYLPPETTGKPFLHEKRLRPIAAMIDWDQQRVAWRQVLQEKAVSEAAADDPAKGLISEN